MTHTTSYEALLEKALREIIELSKFDPREQISLYKANPEQYAFVDGRNGRGQIITRIGYRALIDFAQRWYENARKGRNPFELSSVQRATCFAFIELLSDPGFTDSFGAKKRFLHLLRNNLELIGERMFFYFPIRLFDEITINNLSVGPVSFFRREGWLRFARDHSGPERDWADALQQQWQPVSIEHGVDSDRCCTENVYKDIEYLEVLNEFAAEHDWFASVEIKGFEKSRAAYIAGIAASISLDCVSLMFVRRHGRNIAGPVRTTLPQHFCAVWQKNNQPPSWSFEQNPRGVSRIMTEGTNFHDINAGYLRAAGNALHAFLSDDNHLSNSLRA